MDGESSDARLRVGRSGFETEAQRVSEPAPAHKCRMPLKKKGAARAPLGLLVRVGQNLYRTVPNRMFAE
jgi:hypothetical protein